MSKSIYKTRKRNSKKKSKKKRKISLEEIGKCHPRSTSKNKCLPDTVYSELSSKLKGNNGNNGNNRNNGNNGNNQDVFELVGCKTGEEHCLLDKAPLEDNVKKELRKQYLRPKYPKAWEKDPDMWLDNYNIGDVMRQYEETYPWFTFLGILPIDFSAPNPYKQNGTQECLYKESCELNLKNEYNKGKRGIGIIFNLDPHFKGGSHWVGLYINLTSIKKPFIGYFDSYGYKTPPLIARLMRSFRLQIPSCELGYNARRFQFSNSECGMFSMYFIICMIHGIPFKDFCKDSVNDQYMLQLRHVLFAK